MTGSFSSTAATRSGHYAARHRQAFFLSFSHRRRFEYAARVVASRKGQRLLDYGCGDGTFLAMVSDQFPDAVGADVAVDQVEDCRERLGGTRLHFTTCDALAGSEHTGQFDVVCCFEVLEHCPVDTVDVVLSDLCRLVAENGLILISVPVETGPVLCVKQALRRLAGWMRVPGYQEGERYSLRECVTMLFAGPGTAIPRPLYDVESGRRHHGHKGFNWRALERVIARHMTIDAIAFTPWPWLGRWANSQVWFHARPTIGTPPAE